LGASTEADPAPDTPAAPRPGSLSRRILGSFLYVAAVFLTAWPGGWFFVLFMVAVSVVGTIEFITLTRTAGRGTTRVLLVCAAVVTAPALHQYGTPAVPPLITFVTLAAMLTVLDRPYQTATLDAATSVFGFVYVPLLLGHLVLIRDLELPGTIPAAGVLLPFVLTWACDTGAYLVGRTWGRRRPWPQVSPRKSLEGAIGGLVSTVIAAWLARLVFAPFLGPGTAIVLGLALGVGCQAGDLVESMLKRWAGVKDASRLIPGHGGVLDRFDSLIVSAPFSYYVLLWMVGR